MTALEGARAACDSCRRCCEMLGLKVSMWIWLGRVDVRMSNPVSWGRLERFELQVLNGLFGSGGLGGTCKPG